MIDLHTHVLPGLDDGARDLEESVAIAELAARTGVHTLVATPHIRDDFAVSIGALAEQARALSKELERRGIPVRVLPGGEVASTMVDRLSDAELRSVSLGATGRYVLVEPPSGSLPSGFEDLLFRLTVRGFAPVIAHAERSRSLREGPDRLEALVARGVLAQITAGAVAGDFGSTVTRSAIELVERRLAHCLASDWHRAGGRASMLDAREALEAHGDDLSAYAHALSTETPARIVAGEPVAVERPRPAPRRRPLGPLRGLLGRT